jgi:hypothetical protein
MTTQLQSPDHIMQVGVGLLGFQNVIDGCGDGGLHRTIQSTRESRRCATTWDRIRDRRATFS